MTTNRISLSIGVSGYTVQNGHYLKSEIDNPAFRAIASMIAGWHNPSYGYSHPTIKQIQKLTKFSRGTIINAISEMKDHPNEWIIASGRGGLGGKKGEGYSPVANRYYPQVGILPAPATTAAEIPVKNSSPRAPAKEVESKDENEAFSGCSF